ncbi:MAG: pilin [Pseudomonadota bacterium]
MRLMRAKAPSRYLSQVGFTLVEMMMVVAIIGVLASIAMPMYGNYVTKARLVEVTAFMGEVRTAIMAERAASGEFPTEVNGSQSRIAARQTGQPRVRRRDSRVRPQGGLITEYYYEYNPNRDWAYVAVRLDSELIPDCRGRCMLHMGVAAVGDGFETFCGRWNQAFWRNPFPPSVLPLDCRSESVNRDLRRATRRRR